MWSFSEVTDEPARRKGPTLLATATLSLLIGLAGFARLADAQESSSREQERDSLLVIDVEHPKYFVTIIERFGDGRERVLFDVAESRGCVVTGARPPRADSVARDSAVRPLRTVRERVDAEVDVDSRVVVEFDRCWMKAHSIEGYLTITAQVQEASGAARDVEVPGYSEVGKAQSPAPAFMRSEYRVRAVARQLIEEWAYVSVGDVTPES